MAKLRKNLGLFITTHMEDYVRRCRATGNETFAFYKHMINRYISIPSGINNLDIYIMDTGSTIQKYKLWVKSILKNTTIKYLDIPDNGGWMASLKYIMHNDKNLINNYDYYIFHVDDSVEPTADGWGTELLSHFKNEKDGILTNSHKIKLTKTSIAGNKFPHMPRWYNVQETEEVDEVDAAFFVIKNECLHDLANNWTYCINDKESMDLQMKLENTIYSELRTKNYRACMAMQVGRETDLGVRIKRLGWNIIKYNYNKIISIELGKRLHRHAEQFDFLGEELINLIGNNRV